MLLAMSAWLHERGYRVIAAFFYDRDNLYAQWKEEAPFPLLNLEAWKKGGGVSALLQLPAGLGRLYRLLRREKFAAVLAFTHHASLLGLPLAWLAGVPVRLAGHRGSIQDIPRWMTRLHAWMVNRGIATLMVAVSERVRLKAIEEEGILPERVVVIQNGIIPPPGAGFSDAERRSARERLGVPTDFLLALTVGRLAEQKGHAYLLRAVPLVLQRFSNIIFLLAGDGPLRPDLEGEARQLGIGDAVRFLGTRSDVPYLLRLADLFILPSVSEGMPVALLEAMMVGLPVIASQVEGVDEIVQDGQNGLTVPLADPKALSQAILRLALDAEMRQRLGAQAKSSVESRFTLEAMCDRYLELFQAGTGVRG
jgi:glycosyltransferase involved in cell wall biosynthesis